MNVDYLKKMLTKIYPKLVYQLPKDAIDKEVIDLAIKKKLSYENDYNNVLKSNYDYVVNYIDNNDFNQVMGLLSSPGFSFGVFDKEQLNNIFKLIYQKDSVLFIVSIINLLHNNSERLNDLDYSEYDININNYSQTESLNELLFNNISLENIPNKFLDGNMKLINKYLTTSNFMENRTILLKKCPNMNLEINKFCLDKIIGNIDQYGNFLDNDEFIELLKNSREDIKNKVLDYLLNNRLNLEKFYEIFKENYKYLIALINNNITYLNEIYKVESSLIVIDRNLTAEDCIMLLEKCVDGDINLDIIDYLYRKAYHLDLISSDKKSSQIVFDLWKKGKIGGSLVEAVLCKDYPMEFLNRDINGISRLGIDIYIEYRNQILKMLIDKNYSYNNSLYDYITANISDIDFLIKGIKHNIINLEYFEKLGHDRYSDARFYLKYSKNDLKTLYKFLQNSEYRDIFEYFRTGFIEVLNVNNYELDSVIENVELIYDVDENNKENILEILKTISSNKDKYSNVTLRVARVDSQFLQEASKLLSTKLQIRPQVNQNGGEMKYEVNELIEKDKIMQMYADTTKDQVLANGDTKSLSMYEKYVAAYLIASNYMRYNEEQKGTHGDISRAVYEVIDPENDHIVCAGYVNFLKELLERMGITECCYWKVYAIGESSDSFDGISSNHARFVIHINDPKYGIDGVYIADPTWDNDKKGFKHIHMTKSEAISDKKKFPDEKMLFLNNPLPDNFTCKEFSETKIEKEKIAMALLAVSRFVDKNMPMVKENVVGDNGYSTDEYNEIIAQYFWQGDNSIFLNFDNDCYEALNNIPWNKWLNKENSSHQNHIAWEVIRKFVNICCCEFTDGNVEHAWNSVPSSPVVMFKVSKNVSLDNLKNDFQVMFPNIKYVETEEGRRFNALYVGFESVINKDLPLMDSKEKVVELMTEINEYVNSYNDKIDKVM